MSAPAVMSKRGSKRRLSARRRASRAPSRSRPVTGRASAPRAPRRRRLDTCASPRVGDAAGTKRRGERSADSCECAPSRAGSSKSFSQRLALGDRFGSLANARPTGRAGTDDWGEEVTLGLLSADCSARSWRDRGSPSSRSAPNKRPARCERASLRDEPHALDGFTVSHGIARSICTVPIQTACKEVASGFYPWRVHWSNGG